MLVMNSFELVKNIFAITAVFGVAATAIVGMAFWFFRLLSEKWLDAKFNERLENYRHSQQRELEKLRFSINTLMDRTTKLHQHEFDILPQVWSNLVEAFGNIQSFVSPLQQHADLDNMGDAQFEEFLSKSDLFEWQKVQLKEGRDRNSLYFKMKFWQDYNRVFASYAVFHNHFVKNGIFIQPELKAKLGALSDVLSEVLNERSFEEQYPNPRADRFAKCDQFRKNGSDMLKSIEKDVQTRLWDAQLLEH